MIKVLIIDDSAMVRKVLTEELSKDKDIEIVGSAPDPFSGRDKILKLKPEVIILDIEMPRMDGITFLEKLMKSYPIPVIIYSSVASEKSENAMKAFELGAVDVIQKPGGSYSVDLMKEQLTEKIKAAANYDFRKRNKIKSYDIITKNPEYSKSVIKTTDKIIAIGASTGGTEALRFILKRLPSDMPPIIITQHMPQYFTKSFSESLNRESKLEVKEAENMELLRPGKALIAPGNFHLVLNRDGARYFVNVKDGPAVFHQRPSVEVMFYSVAKHAGKNALGVILTGMGKDGAEGLLKMKEAGAHTLAQDEKSCVVFGMPREAINLGGVDKIISLEKIPEYLIKYFSDEKNKNSF
ncbi:MAG: chemotaxis response regulator protein-glutamate methylesterase [Thermotogae bacterium]|nr:chemotaxis response regulator protein-glutamate methylesterase [Thermotogota bacterium]